MRSLPLSFSMRGSLTWQKCSISREREEKERSEDRHPRGASRYSSERTRQERKKGTSVAGRRGTLVKQIGWRIKF